LITLNEIHNVLTNNKVWKIRLKNVGIYDWKTAISYNLTGVMARSVGLKRDLRLNRYTTYNNYFYLNFNSYISESGDSYDRFLLRTYEMLESLNIINQTLIYYNSIQNKTTMGLLNHNIISSLNDEHTSMENMIDHFKFWSEGFVIEPNIIYQPVESAKGEFGVSLITDGTNKPYRCKIKSPSLNHLYLLKHLSKNMFLADLVTLIGTIDIVFGEIDR
jgi:NADH:ubiquinone oxidoreductase subunit D